MRRPGPLLASTMAAAALFASGPNEAEALTMPPGDPATVTVAMDDFAYQCRPTRPTNMEDFETARGWLEYRLTDALSITPKERVEATLLRIRGLIAALPTAADITELGEKFDEIKTSVRMNDRISLISTLNDLDKLAKEIKRLNEITEADVRQGPNALRPPAVEKALERLKIIHGFECSDEVKKGLVDNLEFPKVIPRAEEKDSMTFVELLKRIFPESEKNYLFLSGSELRTTLLAKLEALRIILEATESVDLKKKSNKLNGLVLKLETLLQSVKQAPQEPATPDPQ